MKATSRTRRENLLDLLSGVYGFNYYGHRPMRIEVLKLLAGGMSPHLDYLGSV